MAFRLYTRNGDDGSTIIGPDKVSKDSNLIHAIGAADAFVTSLDRCCLDLSEPLLSKLREIQNLTVSLAVHLCNKPSEIPSFTSEKIQLIEKEIDQLEFPIPAKFITFNTILACNLNESRIFCRALERHLVSFLRNNKIPKDAYIYYNRLSDYLFCLAFHFNTTRS